MQKKRNTRSVLNATDFFIFIVCTCGILFFVKQFYSSINMTFAKNNEKPVGVIHFKRNNAQRRFVDRNVWERLRESSPIYNGDRIRTAELSEAIAIFQDGTRIEIHENTLLQIYSFNNEAVINFESGDLSVQASETAAPVKVTTGSQQVTLTNESAATFKREKTDTSGNGGSGVVAVLAGNVVIQDIVEQPPKPEQKNPFLRRLNAAVNQVANRIPDNTIPQPPAVVETSARTVTTGNFERINTAADTASQQSAEINVLLPPPSQSVSAPSGSRPVVTWFWKAEEPVSLEFSRDAGFSSIAASCDLQSPAGKENVSIPAVDGDEPLFWRVVPRSAKTSTAQTKNNPQSSAGQQTAKTSPDRAAQPVTGVILPHETAAASASIAVSAVPLLASAQPAIAAEPVIQETQDSAPQPVAAPEPKVPEIAKTEPDPVIQPPEKTLEPEPVPEPKPKPEPEPVVAKKVPEPKKTAAVAKEAPPKKQPPAKKAEPKPVPKKTEPPQKRAVLPGIQPLLTQPANGFTFTEAELASGTITFSWAPVKGASSYMLQLYKDDTCVFSKKVSEPSYQFKKLTVLDSGTFTWRVYGIGTENGSESKTKTASAAFGVTLTALEPLQIDTSELVPSR